MATKRTNSKRQRSRAAARAERPRDLSGFVRVVYSGMCLCGHAVDDHHCQIVQDARAAEFLGSWVGPEECEFYGCNEDAGLDATGDLHCLGYVDRDEPNRARRASWAARLEEARARIEESRAIAAGDAAATKARDQRTARKIRALRRRVRKGKASSSPLAKPKPT